MGHGRVGRSSRKLNPMDHSRRKRDIWVTIFPGLCNLECPSAVLPCVSGPDTDKTLIQVGVGVLIFQ